MTWLKEYRAELADISSDQFDSFKTSLLEHYLEPPRSLSEAAARAWAPIKSGTFDWEARMLKAECIKVVSHEQLVNFYDKHIFPSATPFALPSARLCVEIQSGKSDQGREAKRLKKDVIAIESEEEVCAFKGGLAKF